MHSYDGNFALVMVQIYMIYATLAMGAVPLIYRYCTLVHKHVMTWMQLLPFVEAALLLPSTIVLAAYAVWYENGKEIIRSMNITIANMACEDSGDVPLFTAEQISTMPTTCIPLLCGVMNVTVTYSAITFCTIRIWKAVRKGVFSARMKVLQGQLNSALAIQALNPLLVMALPLAFALGAMLTRSERLSFALPAVTAVTAWIPLMNPLSTIYFIRSYRVTIMRTLCRPCVRQARGDDVARDDNDNWRNHCAE
ncbi:hypothetical protein AAVH_11509 [Aphelenchoides avenae]|nr:hypothetical protein AAVH_11509 [Aphelenchus avenae]